jgi:hypothetical protein
LESAIIERINFDEPHIILKGPCYVPSRIEDPDAPDVHLKAGEDLGYFSVVGDSPVEDTVKQINRSSSTHKRKLNLGNTLSLNSPQHASPVQQVPSPTIQELLQSDNDPREKTTSIVFNEWLKHQNAPEAKDDANFIPPDPLEVLHHMLEVVDIKHSARYGEFLKQHKKIDEDLKGLLRPEAWDVLESRQYTREK